MFGRGDPNLQNVLETGDGIRFVDFEYAGMTDEIYAFADLAAHARSRALPLSAWRDGIGQVLTNGTDRRRFDRCLALLAFFWYLRLHHDRAEPDLIAWAADRLQEVGAQK